MYKFTATANTKSNVKKSEEDKGVYKAHLSSKDFIFSQSSIVASVSVEQNGYSIHPKTAKFVNSNGDCWSNESLKANCKSFIGSWNYVNHVQEPEKSVGFIADVILRRIPIDSKDNIHIYYADILVATSRDHESLCKKILSSKINFMSMGCEVDESLCSKCGQKVTDEVEECDCLAFNKGKYFIEPTSGVRRRIAEVLGTKKEGTCTFVEASWLTEVPAFHGASKRHVLAIAEGVDVEVDFPKKSLEREALQKYLKL